MSLYTKIADYVKEFFNSDNDYDLRKYSKSIGKTFESLLEEFPDFSLRIDKRKVVLKNKNYGVKDA